MHVSPQGWVGERGDAGTLKKKQGRERASLLVCSSPIRLMALRPARLPPGQPAAMPRPARPAYGPRPTAPAAAAPGPGTGPVAEEAASTGATGAGTAAAGQAKGGHFVPRHAHYSLSHPLPQNIIFPDATIRDLTGYRVGAELGRGKE